MEMAFRSKVSNQLLVRHTLRPRPIIRYENSVLVSVRASLLRYPELYHGCKV
jgi:hypothetical protein